MAAVKNKNSQSMSKTKLIILFCVILLLAVPVTLGLLRYNSKTSLIPYHGSTYTFYYPEHWTVRQSNRSDIHGTELFLQPPDAAPPETPYVIIDEAPATQAAESTLTDPFTIFKYIKTDATVNGIRAQKYTNVVNAAEGVFHSTAYVFEAKGNIYLITLGYKQEKPDIALENQFLQIATNFTPR